MGVEAEAAGRAPPKNFLSLRRDLAALPWVLAGKHDIVAAPPQRLAFLDSLRAVGVVDLPKFHPSDTLKGHELAGYRPWGVAGPHLRRSNVTRYRPDVTVCHSLEAVREAVEGHRPKAVLKAEFSSSGLGVRVCECRAASRDTLPHAAAAAAAQPAAPAVAAARAARASPAANALSSEEEGWVANCLRRDGALTVEPFLDILAEFSGEWLNGEWCGVTRYEAPHMRWAMTCLEEPSAADLGREMHDFVFVQRAVERALAALDVPATCGSPTCGMDCAVVRAQGGGLEVRPLELNARCTMTHYALAARRRVPGARRFEVLRVSDLAAGRSDLVPLTDPEAPGASFCAVVVVSTRAESPPAGAPAAAHIM